MNPLQLICETARKAGKPVEKLGRVERDYAITRLASSNRGKLFLFELEGTDFTGYANLVTTRKDVYALFEATTDLEVYSRVIKALENPAPLDTVEFDDYFERRDYTLDSLPFVKYYRDDGSRYLTSSIYVICYEKTCNASYHRTMYKSPSEAPIRVVPRQLHYLMKKYHDKGVDAPVALVLGADPYFELAAAMTPPLGVFEASVAAAMSGYNKVVKTPLYKIPVPANASVVVEGVLSRELAEEGPFTDILMLLDGKRLQPIFKPAGFYVNKHQTPLFHAIIPGLWEHQFLMGFPREPLIFEEVRKVAPGVVKVRLTEGGSGWLHVAISLRQSSPGEAKLAGLAAIAAHPSVKHVFIVDEDIDVDNPQEIEWALATRLKGGEDIIVLKDVKGSTLEPRSREGVGDKVIFLAVKPFNEPWDKYRRVVVE